MKFQPVTLGAVIGGVGTLLLMAQDNRNADREFHQTVEALRASDAVVQRFVPHDSDKGLASLIQLEGVEPMSTKGLAMIYDAMCNPVNEKNLYGFNPGDCKEPTLMFKMPGIKGGYITLRLPSDVAVKNDYK